MASLTFLKSKRQYAVRWREGGRGSTYFRRTFDSKGDALDFIANLDRAKVAAQPLDGYSTMVWSEVVDRWYATRPDGAYRDKAKRYLDTLPWRRTSDATPAAMLAMLAMLAMKSIYVRYVKSFLTFARVVLGQAVDERAALVRPTKTARRPKRPLLDDERIQELVDRCALYGPGNGAIAHLLATYGHRAANVVHLTTSAVEPDSQGGASLVLRVKSGDVIRHPLLSESVALLDPLITAANADPARTRFPDHKGVLAPCLFLHSTGKPWLDGQRWAAWFIGEVFKGTGYYDAFKRAAITRMLDHVDATTVASITGHRTVSLLLNTYSRTNEDRQHAALNALRKHVPSGAPRCTQEKA